MAFENKIAFFFLFDFFLYPLLDAWTTLLDGIITRIAIFLGEKFSRLNFTLNYDNWTMILWYFACEFVVTFWIFELIKYNYCSGSVELYEEN